ncbi:MAG: CotH kinase family protein, partial [Chitinophagales bacterium]
QTNEEQNNWSDFIQLVDVINNTSADDFVCALEAVFDVQQYLWIYALDISAGHWDNYAGNINNYFLYHNMLTGKFEFLSFDCDNTFGVDWLGFDWTEQEVYNWPTGWYEVPLAERLLQVEAYRNQFSTYLKKIKDIYLDTALVLEKIILWRDLIADAAAEDVYRTYDWGYDFNDFWNGFTTNEIDGHTPYGIINFVERRNLFTALQLETYDMPPVVAEISVSPLLPVPDTLFYIHAKITDDTEIIIVNAKVQFNGSSFTAYPMLDDGTMQDGLANDGIYGVQVHLPAVTALIQFEIESADIDGNYSTYPLCLLYTIPLNQNVPAIHINEVLAENNSTVQDAFGNYSDYIELFNYGDTAVDLTGYFLSDAPENKTKWRFPETILQPDEYLLLWADGDDKKSPYHLNFQLNNSGEYIGLYAPALNYFTVVDSVHFPETGSDIPYGRLPNGVGDFTPLTFASPGYTNDTDSYEPPVYSDTPYLTNNPGHHISSLFFEADGINRMEIIMTDIAGRKIQSIYKGLPDAGVHELTVYTNNMGSGIYFISICTNTYKSTLPLIKV